MKYGAAAGENCFATFFRLELSTNGSVYRLRASLVYNSLHLCIGVIPLQCSDMIGTYYWKLELLGRLQCPG